MQWEFKSNVEQPERPTWRRLPTNSTWQSGELGETSRRVPWASPREARRQARRRCLWNSRAVGKGRFWGTRFQVNTKRRDVAARHISTQARCRKFLAGTWGQKRKIFCVLARPVAEWPIVDNMNHSANATSILRQDNRPAAALLMSRSD